MRSNTIIKNRFVHVLYLFFIIFIAFIFFLPIFITILTAIKTNQDLLRNGLWSIPKSLFFGGFKEAWVNRRLSMFFKNSLIIVPPAVLGSLFFSSLAAHAIANFRFVFRKLILIVFIAGMWFPPQIFLIPIYFLAQKLGIYDTYLALVLVQVGYALPFGVLVLSQFFENIPRDVIEAARIDGANEFKVLTKIVWPLSLPALGAVAIFQSTWIWNDFFWNLLMAQSLEIQPIMVGIVASTSGRYVFDWNCQACSLLIAMTVPLLIFIFFQRFFVEGIKMGSIK